MRTGSGGVVTALTMSATVMSAVVQVFAPVIFMQINQIASVRGPTTAMLCAVLLSIVGTRTDTSEGRAPCLCVIPQTFSACSGAAGQPAGDQVDERAGDIGLGALGPGDLTALVIEDDDGVGHV